jgi:hypothetical protein
MSKEQTPITGYGVYSVDNKTGRMELAQGDLFVRRGMQKGGAEKIYAEENR